MAKPPTTNIVIRRGEPNGAESEIYVKALNDHLDTIPDFQLLKGPKMGGPDSPRPHILPPESLFLYAEEENGPNAARSHAVGSLCLMPRYAGTPMFRGLPENVDKAGEIKRMIVFPEFRGRGVASKLIAEAERIAKAEMSIRYIVVETLRLLKGAQSLYRDVGFCERDVWGGYINEDSVCFEKWL